MPKISAEDKNLTVLNIFTTDAPEKQEGLLGAMREIVDAAAYPGWMSSTVHAGVDKPGTANFIQWRSQADLEDRYEEEEFEHRTLPLFGELTTSIRLLQNEIAYTQTKSGDGVEISPARADHTVIAVFGVEEKNQDALVDSMGPSMKFLDDVPGFVSHTVLKGIAARGLEGSFVISYSQWESKEAWDAYLAVPQDEKPAARQATERRTASLMTSVDSNTYQVVHTRAAGQ
ncbi:antibiotic biosynthesis monooxygenase [Streptomyces sp. CBMA152]|uniref:antibiotic biosynthesis monooxygenase family protein n=1 Tax=Streptomyces sp. CBMA152 TaxID=1896312 RepID=UPI0016611C41|nr:antibiotic biosynthesis monooxygenase family protein [Streptomyces sp. CBMA152]MBD0741397.1 Anthrone monooxygenase [Streptomyces sp. CBMA152]